jgi:hypothetical protein
LGTLKLAGLAGRVAYNVVKERCTNPRPLTLREVPPTPDHLTDEWLTLALCEAVPGARVVSHGLGERNDGTTSRRTLQVQYNEMGRQAQLTEFLFTKSNPGLATRLVAGIGDFAIAESTLLRTDPARARHRGAADAVHDLRPKNRTTDAHHR